MEHWITEIIEQYGYLGVVLLIALENLFPPIPSEVILTFGGFMTTTTTLTAGGVIAAATIGSVTGAVILYAIGKLIGISKMEKIIERWGHILRLTKQDLYKAESWFLKYGVWTVFFCRFIPLIRSLISIPAGLARMNFLLFLVLTALGTLIWNTVLVNLGAAVGESWETITGYMDLYSNIVYVLIAATLVLFMYWFLKKRRNV